MAMAYIRVLAISILLLLASINLPKVTAAAVSEEAPGSGSYQFELIHVDANGNFSREQLIRRALNKARMRGVMLSAAEHKDGDGDDTNSGAVSGSFSVPVQYSPYTYIMELKMGSTTMRAVADTGSDIIWTNQHMDCIGNPSFTPTNESCAKACLDEKKQCITCMINQTYGGGKKMKGFLGTETLALPTGNGAATKDVALVCAIEWSPKMLPEDGQGVVGLGRGPMSLVKQLRVTQFSYCLRDPLDAALRSPLWFGGNAQSAAGGKDGWRTTALVEISTERSQLPVWAENDYYVQLDEICINDECSGPFKQEDFKLKSSHGDGDKGLMLVDSGCTYTHLDTKIFDALKSVLYRALGVTVVEKDGMNCFKAPRSGGKPDLVLKFPKADMSVPWASYVEEGEQDFCLYILEGRWSILGNFQQHNVSMLYDLDKKELSFKRVEECSSLTK
uniref:Uncharacterized protein n=1 Tax=Avena sativa TaxID=4498 RepID=A0ACD5X2N2_AVESA